MPTGGVGKWMVWELIRNKSLPGSDRVRAMLCMSMMSVSDIYNCQYKLQSRRDSKGSQGKGKVR